MTDGNKVILTVNGGSSSVKYAAFATEHPLRRIVHGNLERVEAQTHQATAEQIAKILDDNVGKANIAAVGHRIVHGGVHVQDHQRITPKLMTTLRDACPLDLAHLPGEIGLIEAFQAAFTGIPQVACFDTVFHQDMPQVAKLLPIPRKYFDAGIRRFGFHGLSYAFLMQELARIDGKPTAAGKIILAHLGSGASMAAVSDNRPIDTTMGFTPLAGLVMGTRPGDLDPGLIAYLLRTDNLTADALDEFFNRHCGLMGLSETSADMRDLLKRRSTDPRAADAVDFFCSQARKFIGALVTTMGGVDTLVFSGGIGEHASEVRAQICNNLQFLGIQLHPERNANGAPIISADNSPVTVRVIATDEEIMIAQITCDILARSGDNRSTTK